jgi:mono/diheme cytochrome c family protein
VVHHRERLPVALIVLATLDRILAPLTWLIAAFAVAVLLIGPELIGAKKETAAVATPKGEEIFAASGCGSCHTLAKAGSSGNIGPNLDDARPDAARVKAIVTSGSGAMPSFADRLDAAEIDALAEYVSQ